MRNAGLGVMIAVNSFPTTHVDTAVIAFSAMMIPMNMVFTVYEVIQDRRAKRRAEASKEAAT
jgi:predicted Na+-dependent transporter